MKKMRDLLLNSMPTFSKAYHDSGVIEQSILAYITPGILVTLAGVITIVGMNFDQLMVNYNTNVPLNSLILIIFASAIIGAVWFNVRLWQTAKFLNSIDATVEEGECTEVRYEHFRRVLSKQARVLDTKNMVGLLKNLLTYGHLNVTDNDARIIKSKLGFRVGKARSKTTFLSGLLVMLGLLGTFWGLLLTIDAVGDAMGSMSSIGLESEGDGEGAGGMSDFIAGIAAPLKGMGLAFSSSLFGLAGSLLTGFFSHLCGVAQDRFIETTSRWIDERIPAPDKKMQKAAQNPKVAGSDELKAWLAGFVQTSQQTQRKLGQLITSLNDNSEIGLQTVRNTEAILERQNSMAEVLGVLSSHLKAVEEHNASVAKVVNEDNARTLFEYNQKIIGKLDGVADALQGMETANEALAQGVTQVSTAVSQDLPENLDKAYREIGFMLEQIGNAVMALKESNEAVSIERLRELTQPIQHALEVIDSRLHIVVDTVDGRFDSAQEPSMPAELSALLNNIVDGLNGNQHAQNNVLQRLNDLAGYQSKLVDSVDERVAMKNSIERLIGILGETTPEQAESLRQRVEVQASNDAEQAGQNNNNQSGVA